MKIVSVSNHKGGVGKTTSTINIGFAASGMGRRVLLVDLDPQANLTQSLRVDSEHHISESLITGSPLQPVEVHKRLDVVTSSVDLSGAELHLADMANREHVLKNLLRGVSRKYDIILVDSPPSLGLLAINSLVAAHCVIIPLQAHYLALQGTTKLLELIEMVRKSLNRKLQMSGVFITHHDTRGVLNNAVRDAIMKHHGKGVFKAFVRTNIALAEAPAEGLDIFRYAPNSKGAEDYKKLTKELFKRIK